MDLGVPVAGRCVQDHGDPAQEQDLARVVADPDLLLEHLAGRTPAARPPLPRELPVQRRGMLADDEGRIAPRDPEEEIRRAEVPVLDPEVPRSDDLQDLTQQRALLRVAVLAEDDVDGQHSLRVEHDQRLAGQGAGADDPQLLDSVLGAREMVAVEEPDVIARQQGGTGPAHRINDRCQSGAIGPDQGRRCDRFGAVDLAVERLDGNGEGLSLVPVSGVDGGLDAAHDEAHQIHDRGEEELLGVLLIGDVFKQLVQRPRVEGILQQASGHDGQGGILGEPLEDVAEDHRCHLRAGTVNPCLATA